MGEKFFLLHFSPNPKTGAASQLTKTILQDVDIETAFTEAKKLADEELILQSGDLIETEFGYDLRRDGKIFSRYWVHPRVNTGRPVNLETESET